MVQPGKPIAKLKTKQFAAELGVSDESVRRYIKEGIIPRNIVEVARRKIFIDVQAVQVAKSFFKKRLSA